DDDESKMTRDEMRYMMETEGVFEEDELEMLQGIFSLDTKVAREIMVPRTDEFMVDIDDSIENILKEVLYQNYSRIPVYKDDKDKVVRILHNKYILKASYKNLFEKIDLLTILQDPLYVPETIFIDYLLYELKRTQNQITILL